MKTAKICGKRCKWINLFWDGKWPQFSGRVLKITNLSLSPKGVAFSCKIAQLCFFAKVFLNIPLKPKKWKNLKQQCIALLMCVAMSMCILLKVHQIQSKQALTVTTLLHSATSGKKLHKLPLSFTFGYSVIKFCHVRMHINNVLWNCSQSYRNYATLRYFTW